MVAFTSIALGALAAGGLGYSVYSGEQARKEQKQALKLQKQEQSRAEARALSNERRAEQEYAAANRKKPDVNALLRAAQEAGKAGAASTMLTGPGGTELDSGLVTTSSTSNRGASKTPTLLGM